MDTTNTPKSKTLLYVVIAIIVIVVLLLVSKKPSELGGGNTEKNLANGSTYSNKDGTVTFSNAYPDNWPSDAPKYKNGEIQYSGTSNPQTGQAGSAVVLITSDKLKVVVDFYKKELAAKGWTVAETATIGTNTVISATKEDRTFGVYIADTGSGKVSVTIGIGL